MRWWIDEEMIDTAFFRRTTRARVVGNTAFETDMRWMLLGLTGAVIAVEAAAKVNRVVNTHSTAS